MARIPLIKPDLPPFDEVAPDMRAAFDSGRLTNFGPNVTAFERAVSEYLDGVQVLTVSSCTLGLLYVLKALGVGPGSAVVVPSFTFVASGQAIVFAEGTPVFAEVGSDLTISPEDLAAILARRTDVAAVLAVHTYGQPARVAEITQVVEEAGQRLGRKIPVVYDAAHGFGASIGGRRVGTFGTAEVFSLSVTKTLVSVEGGLITTRDELLADQLRRMRNYGIHSNYDAHYPGLNGKMSELHAIVGVHNMRRLDSVISRRQHLAERYLNAIRSRTRFEPVPLRSGVVNTFKDFCVLVPPDLDRASVAGFLADREIETRPYFDPPLHSQAFFRRFADRALPATEDAARRALSLPFFTEMSNAQLDAVVGALEEAQRA